MHRHILSGLIALLFSFTIVHATERGVIESPSAIVSGIGYISGWKCNTNDIELWLTGPEREGLLELTPAQHLPRADTAGVCLGEENNGWIIQVNWNELIGYDMVVARDNGEAFDSRRFTIGHTGLPFVQDRAGTEVEVVDFPSPGKATTLTWSTATQHFEVVRTEEIESCLGDACPPGSGEGISHTLLERVNGVEIWSTNTGECDGTWEAITAINSDGHEVRGYQCVSDDEVPEARLIENSCQDASRAAWCTVSQTCTDEIQGEYATFADFHHGGHNYSCYRVQTACLGPDGHPWASIIHKGRQVQMNSETCFSNVSWTNTFFDTVGTCGVDAHTSRRNEGEHACYNANGEKVYDTDGGFYDPNTGPHNGSTATAVSCTWYCDD